MNVPKVETVCMCWYVVGYMDKELFKVWFLNLFLKHCGNHRPIILVMDNHGSHFSIEVLERAIEERVRQVALTVPLMPLK